jgi:alkylation response protein AidB-like acyl-CoA dehydrogenase
MTGLRGAERDELQAFARAEVRPTALARDEQARFDRGLWRRLAEAGVWRTAAAGEVAAAARAFAGLAHGGLDAPLGLSAVAQWIGAHLLASRGDARQRGRWLGPLLAGEAVVAVCNSEAQAGTQLRRMRSRVAPDGAGGHVAEVAKSAATNLSDADLALVSAWKHGAGEPGLEVFLLDPRGEALVQRSHVERLAGFRTGLTGALTGAAPVRVAEAQLGADGDGPRILRTCFHLERLLIGALVAGIVDALYDECAALLRARAEQDPPFLQHQYVQDKLGGVYAAGRRIEGLAALAVADGAAGLEAASPLLSTLKLTAVDEGLRAAAAACELHGYDGYARDCLAQKAHRDLQAFTMLGGSRELLKISLFRDLRAGWG